MLGAPSAQRAADREAQWGRRIALLSVSLGVLLAVVKVWVGYLAHSAAVVSDGLESAGDVFSSAVVYTGLWLASKPPDYEHPYGHGRYETLAGLAVGAMLLLASVAIFWNGFTHIGQSHSLPSFVIYPLVVAAFLKSCLAAAKLGVAKRIKSVALEADAIHDVTDLLSTGVALVSVGLVLFDAKRFAWADGVGGVIIGGIVFFLSISVVKNTVDQLLDTMPEPERLAEIRGVALSVPGALGIEKCFARRTGLRYHVDLHLEVDPELTVNASHSIATSVRSQIKEKLSWVADVLVHVEPSSMTRKRIEELTQATKPWHSSALR